MVVRRETDCKPFPETPCKLRSPPSLGIVEVGDCAREYAPYEFTVLCASSIMEYLPQLRLRNKTTEDCFGFQQGGHAYSSVAPSAVEL